MIKAEQIALQLLSGRCLNLPDFLHSAFIKNVCTDSREVSKGDLFIALPSVAGNEMQYIQKALDQGAILVLCNETLLQNNSLEPDERILAVNDVRELAAEIFNELLDMPSKQLSTIGITGTNGKSSISFYLAQLLNELDVPCAVMGTLGYGKWNALKETGMTTLPLEKLHVSLAEMTREFNAVAMEVSSHGLDQKRLAGVHFSGAIFSNLSRDHLDYHGTMDAYGAAKAKLFQWPNLKLAVINIDDDFGGNLLKQATADRIVSYGQDASADLCFRVNKLHVAGIDLTVIWQKQEHQISLPLYGEFNAYNVAAALAYCLAQGYSIERIKAAIAHLQAVPGRMEQVKVRDEQPVVLVDYAHTPDALEQVVAAAKAHNSGDVHLVVGCGGDRDQGKRPLMGKIAVQSADKVIFTSDNPRSESAEKICQQMADGLSESFEIEVNRERAIEKAITEAANDDLVLIAGKGHETYQEILGKREYFSDVQCAKEALQLENLA